MSLILHFNDNFFMFLYLYILFFFFNVSINYRNLFVKAQHLKQNETFLFKFTISLLDYKYFVLIKYIYFY